MTSSSTPQASLTPVELFDSLSVHSLGTREVRTYRANLANASRVQIAVLIETDCAKIEVSVDIVTTQDRRSSRAAMPSDCGRFTFGATCLTNDPCRLAGDLSEAIVTVQNVGHETVAFAILISC